MGRLDSTSLKEEIFALGASLVGFANIARLAPEPISSFPRAISIGVRLNSSIVDNILKGPTKEYDAEYQHVNEVLDEIGRRTADLVRSVGYRAHSYPATVRDRTMGADYAQTLQVPFQHKTAATRAGLGWIGKCALLITRDYGPRVRLVTVFTDMPLDVATPIDEGQCGACGACVAVCPARAITGHEWLVGTPRTHLLDAHLCRATSYRLMHERTGLDLALCGLCVAICPHGRRQNSKQGTVAG